MVRQASAPARPASVPGRASLRPARPASARTQMDSYVVAVADSLEGEITLAALTQPLLRARHLDFALLAQIVVDRVLQPVKDARREAVHPEEAEVHAPEQPLDAQILLRVFDRRLLENMIHVIDARVLLNQLAAHRPEKMKQVGGRLLHRGDARPIFLVDLDHLPRTAPLGARSVDVVAKHQQERLVPDELARAPDGMAVSLR